MNNQEQRKLSPPGRENHICNKCGWAYPNPHPSAKHRRAHKKICGKPLGFKAIDSDDRSQTGFSDDEQQQNHSDDERQTPLPKIDKVGQSSDGVGGRPNKSEDEMFADAVTEFSQVDSEKSVERIEDSSPLLKAHAIADSSSSPRTEGSYVGVSVERSVEVDLDCSPLSQVVASTERPDVGVVEDNTENTNKMDEDELNEVVANVPEHVPRNLSESFEAEIKSLESDGNTCPWKEQEKGGGSELKMSDLALEVEPIEQSEENSDVSNNGDLKISANTKTEGEAVHILSVSAIVGDSDDLIEDFKDHRAVKSDIPRTLDSTEVISPLGDGDKDTNMNTREDSVKNTIALDTDAGGLIEGSYTKELPVTEQSIEDFKDHRVLNSEIPLKPLGDSDRVPGDKDNLSGGDHTNEQENLTNELSEIHPNESTEAVFKIVDVDMIQNPQKCPDEEAWEIVDETKISNGGENAKRVDSVVMESEPVDAKDSQQVVKENKIVDEGDVERVNAEIISEDPILQEPSFEHLPYASQDSEQSPTAVEVSQNQENEQVASALVCIQEKGKDSPSKDHSGVDLSADLSSQNSLEANWGSASVLSTQSDARPSVDADNLRLSPQEPAKPEEDSFKNSGHGQVNQSDTLSVVEQGGGLDHNDGKPEAAQQPKPDSLTDVSNESEERKKNDEVMAKVTNWSTEKHQSTPLKSLLGEADTEKGQPKSTVLTTTVKSVLSNEAPAAYQSMDRDAAAKEWNSPEKYPGSKKDRKKVKGKSSWVPFVCCSSVNVS